MQTSVMSRTKSLLVSTSFPSPFLTSFQLMLSPPRFCHRSTSVTAALLSPPRFSHHRASLTPPRLPLLRLVSTAAACHSVSKSHIKDQGIPATDSWVVSILLRSARATLAVGAVVEFISFWNIGADV